MVTAKRLTDPNKRFKLTYDPSKVQLKSVAAQRSIEALTAGTYGKLTVDSVADGEIVFGLDIDLPAETSWSGAITVFELKPLSTDNIKQLILRAVNDKEKGLGAFNA